MLTSSSAKPTTMPSNTHRKARWTTSGLAGITSKAWTTCSVVHTRRRRLFDCGQCQISKVDVGGREEWGLDDDACYPFAYNAIEIQTIYIPCASATLYTKPCMWWTNVSCAKESRGLLMSRTERVKVGL